MLALTDTFIIPQCNGGLWPIFNLTWFNCYMHMPTFKIPTMGWVHQLFNMVVMLVLLSSRILIYISLLLSFAIAFYISFCKKTLSVEGFYKLGKLQPLGFSLHLITNAVTSQWKGFHVIIYLDDMLILTHSKCAGKRAQIFLYSWLVGLGIYINVSKSELHLSNFLFLRTMLGYSGHVSSSPFDKHFEIQQLALSLLQR